MCKSFCSIQPPPPSHFESFWCKHLISRMFFGVPPLKSGKAESLWHKKREKKKTGLVGPVRKGAAKVAKGDNLPCVSRNLGFIFHNMGLNHTTSVWNYPLSKLHRIKDMCRHDIYTICNTCSTVLHWIWTIFFFLFWISWFLKLMKNKKLVIC